MHTVFTWLLLSVSLLQGFEWISFNMVKRTNARGKTTRLDSRVYFHVNGDMVTYFKSPSEVFIMNNKEGELKIYNPSENSVYKSVNYNNSSQNNTFYYFLAGMEDMGLKSVGYTIQDTHVEDGLLITQWKPPVNMKIELNYVEVVSDGESPVFMGFLDEENKYFKKLFFYDFDELMGVRLPLSITEIDYFEEDSVITKTTFNDFQYNNALDKEILDFEVPENARLIE